MQSLVFCLAVLQITQARNIFIQFYIIYILQKDGLAPGKEKSPKDDIDVMIKTILNITEICDLMQNTDQVSLSCYLNFVIKAEQTQIGAGIRMGQTVKVLLVPRSTLLHRGVP